MRIIITQEEIEEAIEKLILDQVDVPEDMRIDIDLKATRGDQGYTAEIDIIACDAPTDGTDRSVDPRIAPVEGAETLGIAEKVLEAKAEASKPRRRGRPAGARNKPKLSDDHRSTEEKIQVTGDQVGQAEQVQEAPQETLESIIEDEVVQETTEADNAPENAPEAAPVAEPVNFDVSESTEGASETEVADAVQLAPEEEPAELNQTERLVEEPVQEVSEEPETAPESPANPQPTRSLFANLSRPTNGS